MIQRINNYDTLEISDLISLLNITDNYNNLMDECFKKVKGILEINKDKDKKKLFKNIKFTSEEDFIKSLVDTLKVIAKINSKMNLKHNTKLYFTVNDIDNVDKEKIITTSSIISPYMNSNNKNRIICANVKKGINILYSPKYLSILDNNIEIVDNNSELLLDTRDVNILVDENTIIYTRFKSKIEKADKYSYVDKFDVNYKLSINKAIIEKREDNE
jgi:hypothetical protein